MSKTMNAVSQLKPQVKGSTFFALMAEFGTAQIPLVDCCEKYLGLSAREAKTKAAGQSLPLPVWRVGSQKSPWMVSAEDLANMIDNARAEAAREHKHING